MLCSKSHAYQRTSAAVAVPILILALATLGPLFSARPLAAEEAKPQAAPAGEKGPDLFLDIDLAHSGMLAGAPAQIAGGTKVRLTLKNLLPGREYQVERRVKAPIKPLEWPKSTKPGIKIQVTGDGPPCRALSAAMETAKQDDPQRDEERFAAQLDQVRNAACGDPGINALRAELLARSVRSFDLTFADPGLEDGAELEIKVHRIGKSGESEKLWLRRYRVGGSDQWTQSLGFTFFANDDHRYFTEPVAGQQNQHLIVRSHGARDIDYSPVYFYTWSPRQWHSGGPGRWFWGVSAGLGFDGEMPVVLAGFSFGLAKNVSITLGVAAREAARLRGQYDRAPRPILPATLSEDQLIDQTYRAAPFLALSFRFGQSAPPVKVEPRQVGAAAVPKKDTAPSGAETKPKE